MEIDNLKKLANQELHNYTKNIVAREREITTQVLHTLAEVDRRKLFAEMGFSSLFAYCTKALGYSDSAAQRRIIAMRLILQIPAIEPKIAQGSLNLSVVAKAQSFFNLEAKNNNPLNSEQKLEILNQLEGKSSRKCDQELAAKSSNPEALKTPDKITPISQASSEIRFVASDELTQAMEKIRGLLAHKNPNMSINELFLEMAHISLDQLIKEKTKALAKPQENTQQLPLPTSAVTVANIAGRHIPRSVQREVYARDGMRCSYVDPVSRLSCDSTFGLELDHIHPFALGGKATADNIHVLCKIHNQLHAIQCFGPAVAHHYNQKNNHASTMKNHST